MDHFLSFLVVLGGLGLGILYTWFRARREIRRIDVRDELLIAESNAGKTVRLAWDDLREVELVVEDAGPFDCDVFWVLKGEEGIKLRIPQDVPDGDRLLSALQRLPGFDHRAVLDAMCETEAVRKRCWQAPAP